eukprot:gnl/TRDRNA2_/TRDRNA2_200267_c0_seq1.p1 gnl/TRDRNA2_/TRDRNA2_200267_c0~~gnl/TRDRNA2_/TRDRNA2_200267_c0_seq1.p1  ORF type:complete len:228 (-),score=73.67 gnl/TRDRNA2_/TRDRNA2_200267_c0_seq1:22-705(-)
MEPPQITGGMDFARLEAVVRDATAGAVRTELAAGLGTIRQIVREELDREDDEDSEDDDDDEAGDEEDGWKLIICVRSDLGMTIGKTAAQVGHAVHAGLTEVKWKDLREWEAAGSKKVTLRVESEEQLLELQREARKRGLVAESVQDAGHTEVDPGTTTVLAVGPARDKDINRVTGHLRPLPDRAQQLERENKKLRDRAERLQKELDEAKRKHKADMKRLLALHRDVM